MADQTVLDGLRAKRQALGEKQTIVIDVPGYDGDLAVRYVWRPYEDLARKGQALAKVKSPTQRDLFGAADILAECCEEVLIRVEGHETPLSEDGDPITFGDPRLGEALGFENPEARTRTAVFRTFENDYALLSTAVRLSAWLEDTSREVDGEFSGN